MQTLSGPLLAMALISAMNGSILFSVSYSPSMSCDRGSKMEFQESASSTRFYVPLIHSAMKL